ncbi:hypothetical protein ccbrp13_18470 [Ktedonobacteria bacterium brp13]|nr:hypothetical protein ccbrp13_18470 [Ktedonobacteria bacterium brp13]
MLSMSQDQERMLLLREHRGSSVMEKNGSSEERMQCVRSKKFQSLLDLDGRLKAHRVSYSGS